MRKQHIMWLPKLKIHEHQQTTKRLCNGALPTDSIAILHNIDCAKEEPLFLSAAKTLISVFSSSFTQLQLVVPGWQLWDGMMSKDT